jgi:hypothetical protein
MVDDGEKESGVKRISVVGGSSQTGSKPTPSPGKRYGDDGIIAAGRRTKASRSCRYKT